MINFYVKKLKMMQMEEFEEEEPEPDPRPPPEIEEMEVFSNSTTKIVFNEPIKLRSEDRLEIIKGLANSFKFIVTAGLDNSETLFELLEVEDNAEEIKEEELTQEEMEAQMLVDMIAALKARMESLTTVG